MIRSALLAAALALAGCAATPAGDPAAVGDLHTLLVGSDLNVWILTIEDEADLGTFRITDSTIEEPCRLVLTLDQPGGRAAVLNLASLRFLYAHTDGSIGALESDDSRGLFFETSADRRAALLNALRAAARACGSRPVESAPLFVVPG